MFHYSNGHILPAFLFYLFFAVFFFFFFFFFFFNLKFFSRKFVIFFSYFCSKQIVGTHLNRLAEAVLTSTHNLCFGAKIRKIGIPLQTPVLLYKSEVKRGIHCTDMFSWCKITCHLHIPQVK